MPDVHSTVLGRDAIRVAVQQQADRPACPHIIPQRIWELGGEMSPEDPDPDITPKLNSG
jgi:hypothetical protein